MRFSIVIPTFNRRALLARCLSAVTSQDYPDYEVLVTDDASSDGTGAMVRQDFPSVRYLRLSSRSGPAAARNRALREARGDIVAFTDDDCVPPRDWLRAHLDRHRDPKVGAVGGIQVPESPSFYDRFQATRDDEAHRELVRIESESITGTVGLATNNMSVKRTALDRAGEFDESFVTGSDPELARRVGRAGYALVMDPRLQVTHLKVDTLRTYLGTRFHRGCGSVLTDIQEGTLSPRRFVPVVNLPLAWRRWRRFRELSGGSPLDFFRFWGLAIAERWVVVAGRAYYYVTVGRARVRAHR